MTQTVITEKQVAYQNQTTYKILIIMGFCHLLNDSIQSVIPAMFPVLGKSMGLSFTQLGFIAFSLNMVSSVMQPFIGALSDKKPMPYALPIGMTSTLLGVIGLALAPNYSLVLLSVLFIGLGSAIFHPEGSRVAHMAAGSRKGLAQSIYQVGGNSGQALAPLITALILVPLGQIGAAWFSVVAGIAVMLLSYIAFWYSGRLKELNAQVPFSKVTASQDSGKISKGIILTLVLILFLIFARSWYVAGITNYYAFFAIEQYQFSIQRAQVFLFAFLVAGALGTFFGGPLADKFGKRNIIIVSILGSAPLSILIPFVPASISFILLLLTGFILMSSFSVTVIYAQDLVPGKIGTMAGLTVGLAFGMGAIGSIILGVMADHLGLFTTLTFTGFLPILGALGFLLPSDRKLSQRYE
ncbi:MFS transporter [Niallia sp. Krafla_26]|uniref:MFS transporter n=1 Tax=Niallia sp. Krafla_26 TaxID=3064703 RepID=UPI003D16BFA1